MAIALDNIGLNPPVFLAPMAGITDVPFRDLVSRFGAGLVVSEMVASQEMVQSRPSARARAELGFDRQNTSVQIAGKDAYWMGECARLCEANGAKIIDINMGCPAKKVTNGYSGSALMRDPDHALSLIETVIEAVSVPVTLKMRLGWDDDQINAPEIAKRAEDAGIAMIVVHGRTRCQFYKGKADWNAISKVKAAVCVPVIANGDIVDTSSAVQALEASNADGVMIGRGAYGKPWLLAEIAAGIKGDQKPKAPTGSDLINIITEHYESMLKFYGTELGNKTARKHLGWYLDLFEDAGWARREILTETDPVKVLSMLAKLSHNLEMAA